MTIASSLMFVPAQADQPVATVAQPGYYISSELRVKDYFAPANDSALEATDQDVGSAGVMLVPYGRKTPEHLAIGGVKIGIMFQLDRNHLERIDAVWATTRASQGGSIELYAYDARDLGRTLFSGSVGTWLSTGFAFPTPTVVAGHVFVPGDGVTKVGLR